MSEPTFDLEAVYDAEICPRMAEIIAVCKRVGMPMFATFCYRNAEDGADFCTTYLDNGAGWRPDEIGRAYRAVDATQVFAMTVTSKEPR